MSDPCSIANLLLYYYKSRRIKDPQKNDLIKARELRNVFRFIDDLSEINDAGIFESNFRDIYPEELELCKKNDNNAETKFLDLDIKLKNNTFQIGLFDKRGSFPFSIVRMPEKSSNTFPQITYPQIYSTCQLELNV